MQAEAEPRTRQQQKDETRAKIFAAATQLFAQNGYHATTVAEIVKAAGVAKGTFFVHFPSKDAVIAALVGIQTGAARKARKKALESEGPVAALRAAVITLAARAGVSRTLSRGVLAATLESQDVGGEATSMFDELFAEMKEDAKAAHAAGLLAPGVDPETLAASLMASYLGSVLHFVSSPRAGSLVPILEPLVDANLAGAVRKTKKRRK
jgi:AcrR family transcriptional regulator